MLVRADAIPVVEMIKSADAVDHGAAALWLHMGLWDALGEMIDDARPEIDAVWKSVVGARSDEARRLIVRQAVERRVEGDEIDDVVKAAAGLSLVRGYVAKDVTSQELSERAAHETRDAKGRFARTKGEKATYDALQGLSTTNPGLQTGASQVAEQLNGDHYDRMRVVGNALVASGHPKAMAAGGAVRIAAEVGPSAENVLGTHLRRVAYRYRGTEKRPDRQLLRETKEAQAYVGGLSATPRNDAERRAQAGLSQALEERKPGEWAKGAVAYRLAQANEPGQRVSEDQIEMRTTGDIATAHLIRQLPSKDEAFLSQEAGRTPPSVGVLIDRDGDAVSESMGYQGDHYVPFDLKNLKRLQGGSYVRTRALGGPTSEDIYTGLLAGARQVQVVSRSGVFTVEFDPDLRGGRRYSDKARQMIGRYSRLLDVVEGGKDRAGRPIYSQDVSDDVKRKLMREALEASDYDQDEADARFERRLKQERVKAGIGYTEDDLDAQVDAQLNEWTQHQTAAGHAPGRTEIGRAREDIRAEVRDSLRAQREQSSVQRLKLNADGYFKAMQSLKREFPYYIRDVSYESLPDFEDRRRTRQRGEAPLGLGAPMAAARRTHVQRGALVPHEQAETYGIKNRRGERSGGSDDGESATTTVDAGRGPKGGAPEQGATFADTLKSEKFQDQVANAAKVMRIANQSGSDGQPIVLDLNPPVGGGPMDREFASRLGDDKDFVKWLVTSGNPVTHGNYTNIARFLTEEATPEELRRVDQGLEDISSTQQFEGDYSPEKFEAFRKMVQAISRAKEPYAKTGGSAALHAPDREDPKPYPFPDVVRVAMADNTKFDKAQRVALAEGHITDEALSWAQGLSDRSAGAELRKDVLNFNAAKAWGEQRLAAKKSGEEPPVRPSEVEPDVAGVDAEEIAQAPEKSHVYRDLQRRQQAWAWVYTKRLRDQLRGVTGGGAAPKAPLAIEGEKSARLATSSRRVVWHSPDDPLSRAFAKRSRGQRRI